MQIISNYQHVYNILYSSLNASYYRIIFYRTYNSKIYKFDSEIFTTKKNSYFCQNVLNFIDLSRSLCSVIGIVFRQFFSNCCARKLKSSYMCGGPQLRVHYSRTIFYQDKHHIIHVTYRNIA